MRINVAEEVKKKIGDKCFGEIYEYIKNLIIEKPDGNVIDELMVLKRVFSNRIRISILMLLSQANLPVCALVSILDKDQTLISHNLSELKKLGVVKEKKIGKYRFYSLVKSRLTKLLQDAMSIFR